MRSGDARRTRGQLTPDPGVNCPLVADGSLDVASFVPAATDSVVGCTAVAVRRASGTGQPAAGMVWVMTWSGPGKAPSTNQVEPLPARRGVAPVAAARRSRHS